MRESGSKKIQQLRKRQSRNCYAIPVHLISLHSALLAKTLRWIRLRFLVVTPYLRFSDLRTAMNLNFPIRIDWISHAPQTNTWRLATDRISASVLRSLGLTATLP